MLTNDELIKQYNYLNENGKKAIEGALYGLLSGGFAITGSRNVIKFPTPQTNKDADNKAGKK